MNSPHSLEVRPYFCLSTCSLGYGVNARVVVVVVVVVVTVVNCDIIEFFLVVRKKNIFFFFLPEQRIGSGLSVRSLVTVLSGTALKHFIVQLMHTNYKILGLLK